jgi:hypothetical protein
MEAPAVNFPELDMLLLGDLDCSSSCFSAALTRPPKDGSVSVCEGKGDVELDLEWECVDGGDGAGDGCSNFAETTDVDGYESTGFTESPCTVPELPMSPILS